MMQFQCFPVTNLHSGNISALPTTPTDIIQWISLQKHLSLDLLLQCLMPAGSRCPTCCVWLFPATCPFCGLCVCAPCLFVCEGLQHKGHNVQSLVSTRQSGELHASLENTVWFWRWRWSSAASSSLIQCTAWNTDTHLRVPLNQMHSDRCCAQGRIGSFTCS